MTIAPDVEAVVPAAPEYDRSPQSTQASMFVTQSARVEDSVVRASTAATEKRQQAPPDERASASLRSALQFDASPPLVLELVINCHCQSEPAPLVPSPPYSHARTPTPQPPLSDSKSGSGSFAKAGSSRLLQRRTPSGEPKRFVVATRALEAARRFHATTAMKLSVTDAPPKPLLWTLRHIYLIYKSKAALDPPLADSRDVLPCNEHVNEFMKQTYGTKRLVEETSQNFINSVVAHRTKDRRVELFAQLLEGTRSKEQYRVLVQFLKFFLADDGHVLVSVPLDSIITCLVDRVMLKLDVAPLVEKFSHPATQERDMKVAVIDFAFALCDLIASNPSPSVSFVSASSPNAIPKTFNLGVVGTSSAK